MCRGSSCGGLPSAGTIQPRCCPHGCFLRVITASILRSIVAKTVAQTACGKGWKTASLQRTGWDSNPHAVAGIPVFETAIRQVRPARSSFPAYQQAVLDHTVHRSTFGAYRRNSRGAVAACLVATMTASSASRTPTRASRTWPPACAWKVKLSCDGRSAYGFAHAGGLAPEKAMTCKGWASVTSARTCRSYQVLVPELGSFVGRWPPFGYVVCVPA